MQGHAYLIFILVQNVEDIQLDVMNNLISNKEGSKIIFNNKEETVTVFDTVNRETVCIIDCRCSLEYPSDVAFSDDGKYFLYSKVIVLLHMLSCFLIVARKNFFASVKKLLIDTLTS